MLSKFSENFTLNTYFHKALCGVLLLNIFRVGSRLLISIILVHVLTTSDYGLYVYIITLLNTITSFSSMGIPNLSSREVAIFVTQKQWGKLKSYIIQAHKLIIINIVVVILLAFLCLHLIFTHKFSSRIINISMLSMLLLPFLSLGLVRSGILRGLKKPVLGKLPEYCVIPGTFMLLLTLNFLLFHKNYFNITSTLLLQLSSILIGFLVGMVLLLKKLPSQVFKRHMQTTHLHVTLKKALPFLCLTGISLINARIDILLLGFLRPSADIGVYQIVILFTQTLILPLMIYNTVASPMIADLHYKKSKRELQKIVIFGTRITFLFTFLGVLFLVFMGHWILEFIYKPFVADKGYFSLIVLAIAQLINVIFGATAVILNMTGHESTTVRVLILTVILNIAFNLLLVPFFGISGSAIATAISIVFGKCCLYYHVYHKVGINSCISYGAKKILKKYWRIVKD